MNLLLHGGEVPKEFWIDRAKPVAEGASDVGQVGRGANAHGDAPAPWKHLSDGKINQGAGVFFGIALMKIGNHADDFTPLVGGIRDGDVIADGIHAGEILFCESLVDDDGRRTVVNVGVMERAAGEDRDL